MYTRQHGMYMALAPSLNYNGSGRIYTKTCYMQDDIWYNTDHNKIDVWTVYLRLKVWTKLSLTEKCHMHGIHLKAHHMHHISKGHDNFLWSWEPVQKFGSQTFSFVRVVPIRKIELSTTAAASILWQCTRTCKITYPVKSCSLYLSLCLHANHGK